MAAAIPVDDALIAIGLVAQHRGGHAAIHLFQVHRPPIMGLQQRLGRFTRRTFSPLSYSQPIALSICETQAGGRGWPLGILQLQSVEQRG